MSYILECLFSDFRTRVVEGHLEFFDNEKRTLGVLCKQRTASLKDVQRKVMELGVTLDDTETSVTDEQMATITSARNSLLFEMTLLHPRDLKWLLSLEVRGRWILPRLQEWNGWFCCGLKDFTNEWSETLERGIDFLRGGYVGQNPFYSYRHFSSTAELALEHMLEITLKRNMSWVGLPEEFLLQRAERKAKIPKANVKVTSEDSQVRIRFEDDPAFRFGSRVSWDQFTKDTVMEEDFWSRRDVCDSSKWVWRQLREVPCAWEQVPQLDTVSWQWEPRSVETVQSLLPERIARKSQEVRTLYWRVLGYDLALSKSGSSLVKVTPVTQMITY